jgi:type VI secretion system protein ImpM
MSESSIATNSKLAVPGFYGKAITHGDFISRNLPSSFLSPWDSWLQRAIAASRAQLKDDWAECYRTSPIWRFCLPPGICGDQVAAGVLMPSVDSVGRYYPMTVASLFSELQSPFHVLATGENWFAECEEAALSCLEESFVVDDLGKRLATLEKLTAEVNTSPKKPPTSSNFAGGLGLHFEDIDISSSWGQMFPGMLDAFARSGFERYSLWWTMGSDRISPTIMISKGLPDITKFVTFFRGNQE